MRRLLKQIQRGVFFLVSLGCLSTSSAEAKDIPGLMIMKDGSTQRVTFDIPVALWAKHPSFHHIQNGVRYATPQRYGDASPSQVAEIRFRFKNRSIRLISRPYAGKRKRDMFLKLEQDGPMKVFIHYTLEYSPTGNLILPNFVVQKEDSELLPIKMSFRKNMANYLKDCPSLQEKVLNRELRSRDLYKIVSIYNTTCVEPDEAI